MKIHFFGNCQTGALRRMLDEDHPGWEVTNHELGTEGDTAPARVAAHVRATEGADVIVAQPVTAWKGVTDLSLKAVEAMKRPGADLVTIPSIVFEGTHPSFCYLRDHFDGAGMPYHEVHTLDMFLRGYRTTEIELLLGSTGFYTARFVHAGMEASLATLRFREAHAGVTVTVSDLMAELGQDRVLMNTINHPRRLLLVEVMRRILRAIGTPPITRVDGEDYLFHPSIPPLPTVLHHLGIADVSPDFVLKGEERLSRGDYLARSIDFYGRGLQADLLYMLRGSRGEEFLAAFGSRGPYPEPQAKGLPPTVREHARAWLRAMYPAFLGRSASGGEIETHLGGIEAVGLGEWLTAFADSSEIRDRQARLAAGGGPGG